jgi:hypothetical protein
MCLTIFKRKFEVFSYRAVQRVPGWQIGGDLFMGDYKQKAS